MPPALAEQRDRENIGEPMASKMKAAIVEPGWIGLGDKNIPERHPSLDWSMREDLRPYRGFYAPHS